MYANEVAKALRLIDRATHEIERAALPRAMAGEAFDRFPIHDEADAERQTLLGAELARLVQEIDLRALPKDLVTTVKVAQGLAERWASAARWYWLIHDPMGAGFYGMFGPTAYCGGMLLDSMTRALSRHLFATRGDLDRYLALVSDLAAIARAMEGRLAGQAERGIFMPRAQLEQAKALLPSLLQSSTARLAPAAAAFGDIDGTNTFLKDLQQRISGELEPAFTSLHAYVEGDYGHSSRDEVGLSQFPGGREVYEELVHHYLTVDMTAEAVHAEGERRMVEVRDQMADLRAEVGFKGDDAAYLAAMAENPKWRADDADGIADVFRRYQQRFAPHVETLFRFKPQAGYEAAPLPAALSASMTFGYYQTPMQPGQNGQYFFNRWNSPIRRG